MGTTEVGNTLGGESGKMGSLRMGIYTGMGRRQNRWIPIQYFIGIRALPTGIAEAKFLATYTVVAKVFCDLSGVYGLIASFFGGSAFRFSTL